MQMQGVKNELFIHKDSLKLVPHSSGDPNFVDIQFKFDCLLPNCEVKVFKMPRENVITGQNP